MRLLLLGQEIRDLNEVHNFSGVYSYFLARALRAAGAEVRFSDPSRDGLSYRLLDVAGVDHIVGMHSRHFDQAPPVCLEELRARFKGAVTQMSDRPLRHQRVDCTFTARDDKGIRTNHCIGWAADPNVCRPRQQPGELCVLVDHPDYVPDRGWDRTAEIKRQVFELCVGPWRLPRQFDRVTVFEIADGEIVPSDLETVLPFTRRHMPYPDACAAYGRASLFMVSHRESLGLTALETALCGALPVVPKGFIQPDRLATIRHVEYDGPIDWPAVLDAIDIDLSREVAMDNSWAAVAGLMLEWFGSFRR